VGDARGRGTLAAFPPTASPPPPIRVPVVRAGWRELRAACRWPHGMDKPQPAPDNPAGPDTRRRGGGGEGRTRVAAGVRAPGGGKSDAWATTSLQMR